jgi:hypothetical protein
MEVFMSLAKYSPTVVGWYNKKIKDWWEKNGGNADGPNFLYDKDGYDSYGYNEQGVDRAGKTDHDYESSDEFYDGSQVYEDVMFDYFAKAAPTRRPLGCFKQVKGT